MDPGSELLTLEEVARLTALSGIQVRELVSEGLIVAARAGSEPAFEVEVVLRIRKIQRLRRDLEVDDSGLGLVLDLLDRVEALERRLRALDP